MRWTKKGKKDFEDNTSIFKNSQGVSSVIDWQISINELNYWSVDNLIKEIEKFNKEIEEVLFNQALPERLRNYVWNFQKFNLSEKFYSYPMTSYFQGIFDFVEKKLSSYEALLVLVSISKFTYYTTLKFWKVFSYTFANHDVNDEPILRIFEVMQRTSLDAIEGMLEKALLLIEGPLLDPYKQHLLIEEIIDLGDDFTYHWSRMLDQVIELTVETFMFQNKYGKSNYSSSTFSNQDETFEDFFEKTKTIVFNDEVNDAFSYFGITKMSKPEEFKKIYRVYAKKFHPDVNPNPDTRNEMKKINVFKGIIEQYYEKYNFI